MNHHWRSQYHQCRLCNLEYDYITHLEDSNHEANFILRKLGVENLTQIPPKYSWSPASQDEMHWQSIPRNTIIDIYRHYFADFGKSSHFNSNLISFSVLLGYSPSLVERFIQSSNQSGRSPSDDLNLKSKNNLKQLANKYLKVNQDYYC